MRLYIIRHGDPDYVNDCLTDTGKLQARALAKFLELHNINKIFSSPNGRAQETAKPTCKKLGLSYDIEEWATEDLAWRDFSVVGPDGWKIWSYFCQNTLLKDHELALSSNWGDMEIFKDCLDIKGGYERIALASDDFLLRLGYQREKSMYKIIEANDDRVALFCHGGMGLALLSHLLAVPPPVFFAGFQITHTGVTILEFENNHDGFTAPRCLCFSDTSHLYKENLTVGYYR